MGKFVGYIRVSTSGQGASGLGLDAQLDSIGRFVTSRGGELIKVFSEVESGSMRQRPELESAIALCRRTGASFVVARLDRFARNVRLIAQMLDSGIEFVASDMPDANRLTLHILAAMSEYERHLISERTKAALRQARNRGVKLGNPNISDIQTTGSLAASEAADSFARSIAPRIAMLDPTGKLAASKLATILNCENILGPRKGRWSPSSMTNLLRRLQRLGLRDAN